MALIEKIQRLKHPGTLSDFRWPLEMPNFARYNSIYGWNGSGKTIISRLLRAIEMRTPVDFDVVLRINGQDVSGSDFDQNNTQVRVFNRDYVQKNVFPVTGDDMAPIVVLGEDNIEKQRVVERLKSLHAEAEDRLHRAEIENNNASRVLDQHCVDQGRVIKDTLRSSEKSLYNNYNKSNYRRRADEMQSDENATRYRLNDGDREKYLDLQHRPTPKAKLSEIDHKLPDVSALAKEVSRVLETTVVSSAIQSLKEDDTLSTWVYKGLHLHRDRNSDRCLFCEQPIPEDRLLQMEAHFNVEYERFLNNLNEQIDKLEANLREAENVPL
ncbi:MAG: AAA family ATPase, partial [Candidatus Latescibacteria bacterium]|nr:AAA family ATPase [Candidatus Latescibacterota bacterium]